MSKKRLNEQPRRTLWTTYVWCGVGLIFAGIYFLGITLGIAAFFYAERTHGYCKHCQSGT